MFFYDCYLNVTIGCSSTKLALGVELQCEFSTSHQFALNSAAGGQNTAVVKIVRGGVSHTAESA